MYTNKTTFYRLIRYSKKYLGILITLILLMLFLVFAELANGWFFKEFIDNLVKHDLNMVIIVFLIGLGVNICMSLALYLKELLTDKFGEKFGNDLREDLFAHIIRLPMSSLDKYHSGGLMSLLINDINLAKLAIGYNLLHLLSSPMLAFSVLIYMFIINWKLAILCASISPLMFLAGKIYGTKIRKNTSQLQNSLDKYTTFAQESLQGISEIKCDSIENKIAKKFSSVCKSILEKAITNCILGSKLFFVSNFVGFLTYAILWGAGGWLTLQGEISVGDLLFFTRLLDRLINPFTQLANRWAQLQKSIASSKRIFEVMEEKIEKDDEKSNGMCISNKMDYTIKLNQINFSYDKKNKIIKDINLEILPREYLSVVGPSGSGKSTFIKLLLGLYKVDSGSIEINGDDISDINKKNLANLFSYINQSYFLFNNSLRENIVFGRTSITDKQVIYASKLANAHDFIIKKPNGYQFKVGENGKLLSGGERARVLIARALLKDTPIIIMDEPTSSLDSESEVMIKEALINIAKRKTIIIVAHKLSTIINADRVAVLIDGKLAELGTHAELLRLKGYYNKIYNLQYNEINRSRDYNE